MSEHKNTGKIKKIHFILVGVMFLSAGLLWLLQWRYATEHIVLKDQHLHVLVAKNPKQWHKGLGGRDDLGKYDGMLFLFPFYEKHAFVMRDMRFPLDMIWLAQGKVVEMAPNVPISPQDRPYIPRMDANAVLELPAGWIDRYDLKIGDVISVGD